MQVVEIVFGIILIALCIVIVALFALQESNSRNMSALSGQSSDSYFGKNSGRTREAMLKRLTKYSAVGFFVLTLAATIISALVR